LATTIERRALRQAALQAGAVEVSLVEAPLAAAIGLGMPVQDPVASAVAVLGAGCSEATLISLGGIVARRSLRAGGVDADTAIAAMLRQRHGVVAVPSVIESLKCELASALRRTDGEFRLVPARTVEHGEPVHVEVTASEVNAALADLVMSTVRMVQETLAEAPPDLAQDVLDQGLYIVGGHARLLDLAELVALETGVSVLQADDPDLVVIRGLRRCLSEMSALHSMLRDSPR
jgi:rod shape-determining protein MreB